MKLRAIHRIEKGVDTKGKPIVIEPGEPFEIDNDEGRKLIKSGAAFNPMGDTGPEDAASQRAREAIIKIQSCETVEEVEELLKNEKRPTVEDAGLKRIAAIKEDNAKAKEKGKN